MARGDGTGWGGRGWNPWSWQWENCNVDPAAGGAKVAGDDGWHPAKLAAGTTSSSSDPSGGKPSSRPTSTFMKAKEWTKARVSWQGKARVLAVQLCGQPKGPSRESPNCHPRATLERIATTKITTSPACLHLRLWMKTFSCMPTRCMHLGVKALAPH